MLLRPESSDSNLNVTKIPEVKLSVHQKAFTKSILFLKSSDSKPKLVDDSRRQAFTVIEAFHNTRKFSLTFKAFH